MYGLVKDATAQRAIERVGDVATLYIVVKRQFSVSALLEERQQIQELLDIEQPEDSELLELGRGAHPFYQDNTELLARIAEIEETLGI